jgi:hypothetical protein
MSELIFEILDFTTYFFRMLLIVAVPIGILLGGATCLSYLVN